MRNGSCRRIRVPNLFGFFAQTHSDAPRPQQVGDSNALTPRNPKEPTLLFDIGYGIVYRETRSKSHVVTLRANIHGG